MCHIRLTGRFSAFDAATNNFFVRNDRELTGDSMGLLSLQRGQTMPLSDNALEHVIVFAPSKRGLLLFRTVIDDDQHLATSRRFGARIAVSAPIPRLNRCGSGKRQQQVSDRAAVLAGYLQAGGSSRLPAHFRKTKSNSLLPTFRLGFVQLSMENDK
jgi:hypothetical protein